jgi:hypothetical protein
MEYAEDISEVVRRFRLTAADQAPGDATVPALSFMLLSAAAAAAAADKS